MDEVMTAISTVGFPIACYLLMFWYVNKKDEDHRLETEALREAILKLNESISNNSAVILELKEAMRRNV